MRPVESPEVGRDALDIGVSPRTGRWRVLLPARQAALGLGATAAPSLVFVLLGAVLGPEALGIIPTRVLRHLDPVVSVALAMLGVFVGLGLGAFSGHGARRLLITATLAAAITIVVVTIAMHFLLTRWELPLPAVPGAFAAVLGICSCASAAVCVREGEGREASMAARIADLDDVPLIVLGGVFVALMAESAAPVRSVLLAAAAGVGVGAAGWLLFERAHGDAERGVFVAGTIVLLGGLAAYLDASPLLSGCGAALLWVRARGAADRIIAADLRKLQHPLVALLLIVAGASIEWSLALIWIAAPLVMFRLAGKLLAGAAAARLTGVPASLLATVLVPPGVMGIALALNVQQVLAVDNTLLVSTITVAAVASEVLAVLLLGPEEPA